VTLSDSKPNPESTTSKRILCVDQARAVAIGAMIMAHFGPGFFERAGMSQSFQDFVGVLTRFATPAFAAIFGVSVGLAYMAKVEAGEFSSVALKLVKRAGALAICAIVVRLSGLVSFVTHGEAWPELFFTIYSVLAFYTLAVALMPLLLFAVRSNPLIYAPILGVVFWAIGWGLAFQVWPHKGGAQQRRCSGYISFREGMRFSRCWGPLSFFYHSAGF